MIRNNCGVITGAADGLAPSHVGARISAGKVMATYRSRICLGPALESCMVDNDF